MRALGLMALVIVLPLAARAQTDAPEAAPAPAESAADAAPEAATAPVQNDAPASSDPAAPAPVQAAPQPAPDTAPVQAAPQPAPPSAPAPAPVAPQPARPAPYAAPAPSQFTPQPSPLQAPPTYGQPIYQQPRLYQPPPQRPYQPPPAQLYGQPTYAQPTYAQPTYAQPTYAQPTYVAPPVYVTPPAQAYPAPLSMPALPPGYIYLPVPYGAPPQVVQQPMQGGVPSPGEVARREELYARLHMLDTRLDELARQRVGIGGSIAMMVLGYGTAVVSGAIALGSFGDANDIKHGNFSHYHTRLDYNNDGQITHRDQRDFIHQGRIASGIAGAGLFLGLASTARLVHNVGVRRAQAAEVRSLRDQRRNIRSQLDYGAGFGPNQMQLSISGRF